MKKATICAALFAALLLSASHSPRTDAQPQTATAPALDSVDIPARLDSMGEQMKELNALIKQAKDNAIQRNRDDRAARSKRIHSKLRPDSIKPTDDPNAVPSEGMDEIAVSDVSSKEISISNRAHRPGLFVRLGRWVSSIF